MAKDVKPAPAAAPKKKTDDKPVEFAFGRENYILLWSGSR
jgi:hypothetical protein